MGKGLPKKYAKMGFKKGWRAYKASKRGKRKTTRRRAPVRKRSVRRRSYAPKRKRKGGNRMGWNFHLLPLLGVAAHPVSTIYNNWGNPQQIMNDLTAGYTGYDPSTGSFRSDMLLKAWGPIVFGTVASWLAGKTGLNRKLPKGFNL